MSAQEQTEWLGWHVLGAGGCIARYEGQPHAGLKVEVGQTLMVAGEIIPCRNGLHASKRILDALEYAPGPVVCRVRLEGHIVEDGNKAAASQRRVIGMVDASTVLHEFACDVAEAALQRERERGREPDERSVAVIAAKRAWLKGEISDKELAAAREAAGEAAWDAARAAAGQAAWAAAGQAAWAAAWAAAGATVWETPWETPWEVAWAAARAAALAAQNNLLEGRLLALMGLVNAGEGVLA